MQRRERSFAEYVAVRRELRLAGGAGCFRDDDQFWSFPCCHISIANIAPLVTLHFLAFFAQKL